MTKHGSYDAKVLRAASQILFDRYHDHGQDRDLYREPDAETAFHAGGAMAMLMETAQQIETENRN